VAQVRITPEDLAFARPVSIGPISLQSGSAFGHGGHFDTGQALWPSAGGSPYDSWRAFALRDLSPGRHGLAGFCGFVVRLPKDTRDPVAFEMLVFALVWEAALLQRHTAPLEPGLDLRIDLAQQEAAERAVERAPGAGSPRPRCENARCSGRILP